MKPTNQTTQENNLSEFDYKMIEEMKAIPELQKWSDQQLEDYCNILKCYSRLIISAVENGKYNSEEKQTFKITASPFKQVA
jgi:hypothetical protein